MRDPAVRGASRALLLAALHPQRETFENVAARPGGPVDWQWLLERAAAHKVTALLGSRVGRGDVDATVPEAARRRLEEAQARARERHAKALRDLAEIDACLRQAGIAYLLVKGPILTQQIYDAADQRHFFDLDLVVRDTEVDAAEAVLQRLGYELWGVERYLRFTAPSADELTRGARTMRASLPRTGNQRSLVTAGHRLLPIDLHWHLMPSGRMRAKPAALWRDTRRTVVGTVDVEVLAPEAALLHLAIHAWCNRPSSFALLHLVDFAWGLHRLPLDSGKLVDLAQQWGTVGDLRRAVYAMQFALGIEPPEDLMRAAGVGSVSRRFARLASPQVLVDRHPPPETMGWQSIAQRVEWGLATQTLNSSAILAVARWAAGMGYRFARGSR